MDFTFSLYAPSFETREPNSIALTFDNWNDYGFRCLYGIYYVDLNKDMFSLGGIKIATYGQESGDRHDLPPKFSGNIGDQFYSVGTSEEYYEKLNRFGPDIRDMVLTELNDIAKNSDIFEKARNEDAFQASFLRGLELSTITGQFRRMAYGGSALTPYSFMYSKSQVSDAQRLDMVFSVEPESNPPTNVHVVIGKNGVGKTMLTDRIIGAFYGEGREWNGKFTYLERPLETEVLANVTFVSFSVFDEKDHSLREKYHNYSYIGILKSGTSNELKSQEELCAEFHEGLRGCRSRNLGNRLSDALSHFKRDSQTNLYDLIELIEDPFEEDSAQKLMDGFRILSSGHKIAILTIVRLVEKLQDRSLLIMDEPEAHLHPPLLSALVRTISGLLQETNGVAIIATHSPVVLQEVPKSCVYKLYRSGDNMKAERPSLETFGEGVGTLTNDVFGLEVMDSGFYEMIIKVVEESNCDYEQVLQRFDDNLGMEARSIIMAHIAHKKRS